MNNINISTWFLNNPMTGIGRYLIEILSRWPKDIIKIEPHIKFLQRSPCFYLWEQSILPVLLQKELLWSPHNTGPILYKNQVVTLHDILPIEHPGWCSLRYSSWYKFIIPKLLSNVKHIITDSKYSAYRIKKIFGISENKITFIPLGVERKFYPRISDDDNVLINKDIQCEKYILSLASFASHKNLERLLYAWQQASKKLPSDIWLILAGNISEKMPHKLPVRTRFIGKVNEDVLPILYSNALLFVFVSLYEGFGLPPLEAMACGAPVLTSNVTSLPEITGNAALQVDPYCIDAITNGIVKMILDKSLREEYSYRGLKRIKKFDWKKTAEDTLKVINRFT